MYQFVMFNQPVKQTANPAKQTVSFLVILFQTTNMLMKTTCSYATTIFLHATKRAELHNKTGPRNVFSQ